MRNLRLLATVLFVAVLLVGVVLLLRQTNVSNDTSVTSTNFTSQRLAANTAAQTDPPIKVKKAKGARISNGVQPVRTKLENSKGSSARTSATQGELTPIEGLSIVAGKKPIVGKSTNNSSKTAPKAGKSKLKKLRTLNRQ